MNFYNEHDLRAAEWIRELIRAGLIPDGVVDTRGIEEIQPQDLEGFTQCHFFAGIAGWSLALQLAGWPATRPVWTGSCPCQPFSNAGKGLGENDPRHLWPHFLRLIQERQPATVFGEQVASLAGRKWLSGIRADLEGVGYAVGGGDLCAASVGAPHIRQRLFWVANAHKLNGDGTGHGASDGCGKQRGEKRLQGQRDVCGLAHASGLSGAQQFGEPREGLRREQAEGNAAECAGSGGVGDADGAGLGEQGGAVPVAAEQSAAELRGIAGAGFWDRFDIIPCTDGKARRIESGSFPLADGFPGRVGILRGYGNAIVPQVAAVFIRAASEAIERCES